MVLMRSESQLLTNQFRNLKTNQPVQMNSVNDILISFEVNKNPGYTTALKLYIQETKNIDKETDKLYISVSNVKYIIYTSLR